MALEYTLLLLFYLTAYANILKERDVFVPNGGAIVICCNFTQNPENAVILSQGDRRLRSLLRHGDSYTQYDVESPAFFADHPGYSMKEESEEVENLCISKKNPGASIEDDKLSFSCILMSNRGLGKVLITEVITLRIYEYPMIDELPIDVEVREGNPATLKCVATGRPDLRIIWRKKNSSSVLAISPAKTPEVGSGKLTLDLTLHPLKENNGESYVCEASTSYPSDLEPASQVTTLRVTYPPALTVSEKIIYADLSLSEDVKLLVTGNPQPTLSCLILSSQTPRDVLHASDGVSDGEYHIRIRKVDIDDLGDYECTATNNLGIASTVFTITLGPSPPTIVSQNSTKYADYYLLGFRITSKSPLRNVTWKVLSISNTSRAFNYSHPERKVKTVNLRNETVYSENSMHEVWQHMPNLLPDSQHHLYLSVCNRHACSASVSHGDEGVDAGVQPDLIFKTASFDGTNRIDPDLLLQPPSLNMIDSTSGRRFGQSTSSTNTLKNLKPLVLSLAILVLRAF